PVLVCPAQVGGDKVRVVTFGNVVDAPVKSVDIHLSITVVASQLPHGEIGALDPEFTRVLGVSSQNETARVLQLQPGINREGPNLEMIELGDGRIRKQREGQLGRTVLTSEPEPQAVFRRK